MERHSHEPILEQACDSTTNNPEVGILQRRSVSPDYEKGLQLLLVDNDHCLLALTTGAKIFFSAPWIFSVSRARPKPSGDKVNAEHSYDPLLADPMRRTASL